MLGERELALSRPMGTRHLSASWGVGWFPFSLLQPTPIFIETDSAANDLTSRYTLLRLWHNSGQIDMLDMHMEVCDSKAIEENEMYRNKDLFADEMKLFMVDILLIATGILAVILLASTLK